MHIVAHRENSWFLARDSDNKLLLNVLVRKGDKDVAVLFELDNNEQQRWEKDSMTYLDSLAASVKGPQAKYYSRRSLRKRQEEFTAAVLEWRGQPETDQVTTT